MLPLARATGIPWHRQNQPDISMQYVPAASFSALCPTPCGLASSYPQPRTYVIKCVRSSWPSLIRGAKAAVSSTAAHRTCVSVFGRPEAFSQLSPHSFSSWVPFRSFKVDGFFFSLTEVMPYESFKNTHSVSIRGLAQDQHTGAWRYVLQVTTKMQERFFIEDQPSPIEEEKDHSKVETTPQDHLHASPMAASCASHVYCIRRSWSEFKQLHREMAAIMGSELPALPTESIVTFFLGETQSSLLKRRMRLEAILKAIEGHAIASDASAYLEFLANRETYDRQPQVTPLSPVASYRHSSRGQRRMSSEVRGASSALNVEYLRFSLH